jgi:hypothetical protein
MLFQSAPIIPRGHSPCSALQTSVQVLTFPSCVRPSIAVRAFIIFFSRLFLLSGAHERLRRRASLPNRNQSPIPTMALR